MLALLVSDYVDYLIKRKHSAASVDRCVIVPRTDQTRAVKFDIIDDKNKISPIISSNGHVTYKNSKEHSIVVVDYEDFLNKLYEQLRLQSEERILSGIKRCDYIVYDDSNREKIVFNELSTGSPNSKRQEAVHQLHSILFLLSQVPIIKIFIHSFAQKQCVFSCRPIPITPNGVADAFNLFNSEISHPIPIGDARIRTLGFELFETDQIDIT